jgi:SpoVK/Ycf46/Vps4 family AAA+-type ATPase
MHSRQLLAGKTSFIKALAEHTGRSIININLSMIRTNKHLMKIFFNKCRSVEGEYMDDEVGFKDAIFVMEDVDSASNVVKRRDGKTTSDVVQTESVDIQPKSIWHMLLNSNDSDCQALVTKLMELSEKLAAEAKKPEVLQGVVQQMKSLPGLTVVSETVEDPSLKKIGDDALEEANKIMEKSTKVSEFLAFHARKLTTLLESGAEISDDVVNELLETGVSTISETELNSANESARDVSWSKPQWGFSSFVEQPLFLPSMKKDSDVATTTSIGGKDVGTIGSGGKGGAAFGAAKGGKDDFFDMKGGGLGGFSPFASVYSDALNLSGLLNCLDGVVDSPGRLVILTSNHPEVLDPALVRGKLS